MGWGNIQILSVAGSGNNIFGGAGNYIYGLFLSTNNGSNWSQSSLTNRVIYSLAVNGNNVFAGTNGAGVFLSTNNGITWTQTSLNIYTVQAIAVNGNNVFAGTFKAGVYSSTNNGTTWTQTSLNNTWIYSLTVYGNNIFAGTPDVGIFVSTDNGINWTLRNEGLGDLCEWALCTSNNYIFAGTSNSGVYRRPLGELVNIKSISKQIPTHYALRQNYPNPFNPTTEIEFDIPEKSLAKLVVYDAIGREVATLLNKELQAGSYRVNFDGRNLTSGVYFYRLFAKIYSQSQRMILIR